jgi:hypothetical protein
VFVRQLLQLRHEVVRDGGLVNIDARHRIQGPPGDGSEPAGEEGIAPELRVDVG